MQRPQENCQRKKALERRIVALGDCLSMWAGIPATTADEKRALSNLLTSWDNALKELRAEKKQNVLFSDTL